MTDVISAHVENTSDVSKHAPVDILAHDMNVYFTVEEEKRVLRRIDYRVLPLMLGAYSLQQLDKSSLSYTSVFNIQKDAGLVGRQYSWLGSILYIAQLVMQPLGALLLVKLPTGKLISTAIFLWGVTMCGPSLVAVTQMWWRRSEQTNRTSAWNAMNGITFVFGSLSTYGLGHIKSDALFSYQIIFLYCGGLTLVFSVVAFIFFPDSPMEAKFWREGERDIAIERLRANQMGIVSRKWRIPSGGIGTFGPLIVQSFGFNQFKTILFNIPFGIVNIIAILCGGWLATRIKSKGVVIAILALPCIAGASILLALPRGPNSKGPLLLAYYLTSFLAGITPLIYSWHIQNTAGDTKRKVTTALVFVGMCAGNIIGPLLYSAEDKPYYRTGLISNLAMFCFVEVLVGIILLYLKFLNVRHSRMRSAIGKAAHILDESMMRKADLQNLGKGVGQATPREEDNAFADMTDLKNEDFIYVY
ncbi:allantoate permease [Phlyctema vagabunda]|uniref:Allantoate permease n=1 Tax=Phlyctema vagabunda TaxID=108571 RepID=A0ABR4PCA2_9HELO